jgi:transposase InsO family protein
MRQAYSESFIVSFNEKLRDKLSNETFFPSLDLVRKALADGKEDYNRAAPHGSIGSIAPFEFALLDHPGNDGTDRSSFLGLRAPPR